MTNLNINRKQGSGNGSSKQIEGDTWSSVYLPAICAGIIMTIVLFVAIACSKKSDTSANRISAPSQPSISGPAPATIATALPAPPKPKKIRKHRPANATYVNGTYGVSFSYPVKYSLAAGNGKSTSPVQTGFVKPGAVQVAAVDVPDDSYPDTDFSSALLNVSVNPGMTADECSQFVPSSKDTEAAKPSTVKLGSNQFTALEQMNGEMNRQADLKYYHVFKNGACYEFALDVETSRKADEDLAQVDRMKVFQQLQKVLATARIKDVEMPVAEKAAQTEKTETPAIDSNTATVAVSATDQTKADKSQVPSALLSDSKTEKAQVVSPEQK
ncbi:MAG TPA: hypothetical protein VGL74_13570 [Terriglobales bacterium]|jgi:hypothetical protein